MRGVGSLAKLHSALCGWRDRQQGAVAVTHVDLKEFLDALPGEVQELVIALRKSFIEHCPMPRSPSCGMGCLTIAPKSVAGSKGQCAKSMRNEEG